MTGSSDSGLWLLWVFQVQVVFLLIFLSADPHKRYLPPDNIRKTQSASINLSVCCMSLISQTLGVYSLDGMSRLLCRLLCLVGATYKYTFYHIDLICTVNLLIFAHNLGRPQGFFLSQLWPVTGGKYNFEVGINAQPHSIASDAPYLGTFVLCPCVLLFILPNKRRQHWLTIAEYLFIWTSSLEFYGHGRARMHISISTCR